MGMTDLGPRTPSERFWAGNRAPESPICVPERWSWIEGRRGARVDLPTMRAMSAFHEIEMNSITGEQVSFEKFTDTVCLVVNVASE